MELIRVDFIYRAILVGIPMCILNIPVSFPGSPPTQRTEALDDRDQGLIFINATEPRRVTLEGHRMPW